MSLLSPRPYMASTFESRATCMDSAQVHTCIYVRRCTPIVLIVIASIFLPSCPIHDITFMNIIKCGYYSRATLHFLPALFVQLLFEGGYYSGCSFYWNKYGICAYIIITLADRVIGGLVTFI